MYKEVIFTYFILALVGKQVKVVLRADVTAAIYNKVAIISGLGLALLWLFFHYLNSQTLFHEFLGRLYA